MNCGEARGLGEMYGFGKDFTGDDWLLEMDREGEGIRAGEELCDAEMSRLAGLGTRFKLLRLVLLEF